MRYSTTSEQDAWAAGMVDADGCIRITGSEERGSGAEVHVTGVDLPALQLLQRWYGGKVRDPSCGAFRWYLTGPNARTFARHIMGHLRIKQRQAQLLLLYAEAVPKSLARKNIRHLMQAEKARRYTLPRDGAGEEE